MNYSNILINIKKNDAKIYSSELTENQSKSLIKEFQNLHFINLNNFNISKPLEYNYSVLWIELYEKETEIEFEAIYNTNQDERKEEGKDDDKDYDKDVKKDDKDGLSSLHIILISVFGILFIIIVLFLILRYIKKRNKIDFERITENINKEGLMTDIYL